MLRVEIEAESLDDLDERALDDLDSRLDDLADFIFTRSQENCPVDVGNLKRSGTVSHQPFEKEIMYAAPYAAYVEYGTAPHMPPWRKLIRWAKRTFNVSQKEAERAAKAVAWKIYHHGTEPHPYLRPAIDVGLHEFRRIMRPKKVR